MSHLVSVARGATALVVSLATLAVLAAPSGAAVSQVGACVIAPNAQCPNANLSGADLSHAKLSGANLQGANLGRANLDGADLHGSNLNHANLASSTGRSANLSSVLLQHTSFHGANYDRANFDGSQFDYANLDNFIAMHASAVSTNFAIANMTYSTMGSTDFQGANFHGTTLTNAWFPKANIKGANFTGAHFQNTTLTDAIANYNHYHGTILWPSNFDSDETAKKGLFLKIHMHLNAYGPDYGECRGQSGDREGHCVAWGEGNATYGFGHTAHRAVSWEWSGSGNHHVILKGTNGVELHGLVNRFWGDFDVSKVVGIPDVEATGYHGNDHHLGQPNGKISMGLNTRYWYTGFFKAAQHTGYVMDLSGWLPRTHK